MGNFSLLPCHCLICSLVHPLEQSRPVSPRSEFWAGAKDIFPLVVGAIPFGLIFGALAVSSGLSAGGTLAMSALVFAGSSQFIAVGMIAANTGWLLIVLTAFVVNLRHLLYAVSLVPYIQRRSQRWKIPLAFLLTDEVFAVAIRRYEANDLSPYKHWTGASLNTLIRVVLIRLNSVHTAMFR